jgi:uncharacterized SAM-binding protein YcdF (DUF218 family)
MRTVARHSLRFLAGTGALAGVAAILALALSLTTVMIGFKGNAVLPADCALVFGASVMGYNRPGPAITRRVSTAVRLYKEGSVKRLIMAGGVGRGVGESLSEAAVMRAEAVRYGVQSFNIITEDSSHSTKENLNYSAPLAKDCESVVGISDGYHLARIRVLAYRQGFDNFTVLPADSRPGAASEFSSIVREVFGLLYYALQVDRIMEGRSVVMEADEPKVLRMP